MAMDAATLAEAIVTAVESEMDAQGLPSWDADQRADAVSWWTSIGGAIIDHISTDAEVGLLDVDLDPPDGTPDGETIPSTGVIS